jgi:hypothetical protein
MAAKKIVVKQSTIDSIKKLGMTAALKKAGSSNNAEYLEGIKRMYGAKRLSAAQKKTGPKASTSADVARAKYKPAAASSADVARGMATKPKAATPKYTPKNPKPMNPKGLFPGLLTGKYKSNSKPTPKQKPTKAQSAYGKARAGGR